MCFLISFCLSISFSLVCFSHQYFALRLVSWFFLLPNLDWTFCSSWSAVAIPVLINLNSNSLQESKSSTGLFLSSAFRHLCKMVRFITRVCRFYLWQIFNWQFETIRPCLLHGLRIDLLFDLFYSIYSERMSIVLIWNPDSHHWFLLFIHRCRCPCRNWIIAFFFDKQTFFFLQCWNVFPRLYFNQLCSSAHLQRVKFQTSGVLSNQVSNVRCLINSSFSFFETRSFLANSSSSVSTIRIELPLHCCMKRSLWVSLFLCSFFLNYFRTQRFLCIQMQNAFLDMVIISRIPNLAISSCGFFCMNLFFCCV